MTKSIAIILPAHNEALTIADVVKDFATQMPTAEIIVVDNASSDDTGRMAEHALKTGGVHGQVLRYQRKGKARAMRYAFEHIEADVYVMVDADSTYLAADLPKLLGPVLDGEADIVIGNRLAGDVYKRTNTRPLHYFGNRLMAKYVSLLFSNPIQDLFSGYRVMSRDFVKQFPILASGFELETEMSIHAVQQEYRILEIPVQYQNRPSGSESKLSTFRDGFRVLRLSLSIFRLYRPLFFFASLGVLVILGGFFIGFPVITEYLDTGLVPRLPTAVLASALVLVGFINVTLGIILDAMLKLNKRQIGIWRLHHTLPLNRRTSDKI